MGEIFRRYAPQDKILNNPQSIEYRSPLEASNVEEYKQYVEALPFTCFSISQYKDNLKIDLSGNELSEERLLHQAKIDLPQSRFYLNNRLQQDFESYHKEMVHLIEQNAPFIMFAATQAYQAVAQNIFDKELLSSSHLSELGITLHNIGTQSGCLSSVCQTYRLTLDITEQKLQIESYLYLDIDQGEGP